MLQNMQLMYIWYSNTSKSELTTRQLGKSYLAAPNASVPACTRFWCHIWQCLALTLLCRSRKVVLLGSWFSFIWLQWHLCDRGFLGYVVFHWTLCSRLLGKGKQQVKSEKETAARLRVREQNSRVFQDHLWFLLARQPTDLDSCFDRLDGSSVLLNRWLLLHRGCRCSFLLRLLSQQTNKWNLDKKKYPGEWTSHHSLFYTF